MTDTPAHDQKVTHSYTVHYPEHAPRPSDPHYVDFNHYRRQTEATAKCAVGEFRNDYSECDPGPDSWPKGLELHHSHVEFALQNGVDLKWLEADYPGISNPDELGSWVESAANLEWLCVLPEVPVRMADGSEKAIADVRPGDRVITHNGTAQPVLATCRKPYSGEVFRLGETTLTPTHRVLTHRGWTTAAEVARQFRMHGPDVVGLRCEEEQVFRGVVRPFTVDVMDALGTRQSATDHLLHNPAMLHRPSRSTVDVDNDAHITLSRDRAPSAVGVLSRCTVQSKKPAVVRAVVNRLDVVSPHREFSTAPSAIDVHPVRRVGAPPAPFSAAVTATGRVAPRKGLRREKSGSADHTLPPRERSANFYGGWYALREVSRLTHTGYVHDITIANSHSFVAGGMVVHNCTFHHRGHGGVHVASSSDFEAERFVRKLIT